jgi:hypothetical protein
VTAIEAVNSTGWALSLYVIFKVTKYMQEGWFETLLDDWKINISDNGWITDKIGMDWLINYFILYINSRVIGRYRMLILDGHGSYLTAEFDCICTENNIILVCMPLYFSYLLQSLDVSCFVVIKWKYG